MKKLHITLIGKQQLFVDLSIGDNEYGDFLYEFLSVFEHKIDEERGKIIFHNIQVKSIDTDKRLRSFLANYKDVLPKLFTLHTFFKMLNTGEPFLLYLKELDRLERIEASILFKALDEKRALLDVKQEHQEQFGNFLERYEVIHVDGSRRFSFGVPDKSKRVCRYCNLDKNQGATFKKTAHVISEALGNKQVVDFDECDKCNEKFGNEIEPDLITYLDFYRSMFAIPGKEGPPSIKGKNFLMTSKEGVLIESDKPPVFKENKMELNLLHSQKLNRQNIYKTLCKFGIGLMPKEDLPQFKKTIHWLNRGLHIEKLPLVAHSVMNKTHGIHPILSIFRRVESDFSMPYAFGIFGFTVTSFLFIIPSESDNDFTDESKFMGFWRHINSLTNNRGWEFIDLSSNER